ncbi:magnesium transporter [Aquibaculum arenosum]|uniref:Magnesium transporter MgtE n=1 Tax=Aquibaculum arenosum TaxID=3032591 RepID=A0ABT5YQP4_9PROT|nr:magnesium transporter [Fodinicurvata sp. CAU 1616]MDF2097279.1 magnesium transporter [Fodinicurvata sp. CAU 1616]
MSNAEPIRPEEGDALGLGEAFVREVEEALAAQDSERVNAVVENLHPADAADLLEALGADERRLLLEMVGTNLEPETLTYLDAGLREPVAAALGPGKVARILELLESDDALAFFEDLDEELRAQILARVPVTIRRLLQEGLTYPEDSAGRLMQREMVVVPSIWTVGETIDYMRAHRKEMPTDFYDLYVVDPRYRPIGKLPLSRVMRHTRPVRILTLMDEDIQSVPVTMDQEEVAWLFKRYSLLSAPVVDDAGRLVGVITVDDVLEVVEEEAEDDLLKLGGVGEADIGEGAMATAKRRIRWLVVTLFNTIVASLVISRFEGTIEEIVALAILMPIVAAMGGNAGMQVVTVTVRALATRALTSRNTMRVVGKEVLVGLTNGLVFATIMGTIAGLWFGRVDLALVLATAMIFNMAWAGLAGTLIPLSLERFGFDPAVAAGPFLTTTTDVLGFFIFLGLATTFLL